MRGEERQQRSMLMVLNMEQRVAKEHPLRRIKQLAETVLQGLSASFDRMYSATGRPSIPPERLLKATLLMALQQNLPPGFALLTRKGTLELDANGGGVLRQNSEFHAELVFEFIQQGARDHQPEGLHEAETEQHAWQSAEHQGRNVNIGVGDDSRHRRSRRYSSERRSTSS